MLNCMDQIDVPFLHTDIKTMTLSASENGVSCVLSLLNDSQGFKARAP